MATPGTEQWARDNYGAPCTQKIVTINFCGKNVTVNKPVSRHFKRLAQIFREKAPVYAKTIDDFQDDWGYVCKVIAGTTTYSNHAFGLAVDIDATRNARGGTPPLGQIGLKASAAVHQAEREGFRWGGRYSSPDPMHFESMLTPAQIKARYKRDGTPRGWWKRRIR